MNSGEIEDVIAKLKGEIESLEEENRALEHASNREFDNPPGWAMPATNKIAKNNEQIDEIKKRIGELESI